MYKNKHAMYNEYLLFYTYQSNTEVEVTESTEMTNKLCNGITLVCLLIGAFCQRIVSASLALPHHMRLYVC